MTQLKSRSRLPQRASHVRTSGQFRQVPLQPKIQAQVVIKRTTINNIKFIPVRSSSALVPRMQPNRWQRPPQTSLTEQPTRLMRAEACMGDRPGLNLFYCRLSGKLFENDFT